MGEPVRIDDLARSMIRLAGLSVRDESNPDGEVDIQYTGLRPGEKLFEELLIGGTWSKTTHPRILRTDEPMLDADILDRELGALRQAMDRNDKVAIQEVLFRAVEGYSPTQSVSFMKYAGSPAGAASWLATSRTVH